MYRPPVSITWKKGHSNNQSSSNESSSPNTKKPFAKPVDELPSCLDWSRLPTLPQVIALKRHLIRNLPIELVDIILSFAHYWPHASNSSSAPRTVRGKKPHISPPPDSRASGELPPRRSEIATEPTLTDLHNRDNLLIQSPPLGLSQEISQPWLPPKTQHPARKLIVEIKARRVIPAHQVHQPPYSFRTIPSWLEIGVVRPTTPLSKLCSLPPSRTEREAHVALPNPPHHEGGENLDLNMYCDMAYFGWLQQRQSRVPGCLTLNLHVNDIPEGQTATITTVYRFDDDTNPAHPGSLYPKWDLRPLHGRNFGEAQQKVFLKFVKALDVVDRRDGAEFVRALQIGDEVGVWSRMTSPGWVNGSDNVTVIEGVRVTVFWEV